MKLLRPAILLGWLLPLVSCTLGPDYQPPADDLPSAWKNAGFPEPLPPGDWFLRFRDPTLNSLMRAAESSNQDLRAAFARYDQARAVLGLARADQAPAFTADLTGARKRDSGGAAFQAREGVYNDYNAQLNLDYEIDLWGRVRRLVRQAEANMEAAAADYDAALLSLKAEIARDYLTLRALDRESAVVVKAVALRSRRRGLIAAQRDEGQASGLDYERAVTEEESARADLARLADQRGRLVNALAALSGRPATSFALAPDPGPVHTPSLPAGVPSDLLRRRPDVRAAERRLAAASEGVSIAVVSYLPRLTLTGSGGVSALDASDLFNASSRFWSLGPSVFVPIFQGGRIKWDRAQAEARFREALANYRSVLLIAIRDTESALQAGRHLDRALASQRRAAAAADRAAELSNARRQGGLVSLFEVIESDRTALDQERLLAQTLRDRQLAAVTLIQALGGGWLSP